MPPFTVLHVCMGNICRSPMAERLTVLALDRTRSGTVAGATDEVITGAVDQVTSGAADEVYVHSVGTGGWHAGEEMDPAAARQVLSRGGALGHFRARQLRGEHLDSSDLILTATEEQVEFVLGVRPDAYDRTFVIGHLGRLLGAGVVPIEGADAYERGVALVEEAARRRHREPAVSSDELDDPWGRPDRAFAGVADQIEATVNPLAALLLGRPTP